MACKMALLCPLLAVLLVTIGAGPAAAGHETTKNVACSAGLVAVKYGTGIICVAGAGGDNVLSGNQVASGNGAAKGSGEAIDTTTAGNGGSIIGRKLLGGDTSKNVACSAGFVAVKSDKGIICVAGDGGSNLLSGNQVVSGNGGTGRVGGSGKATDTTTAGNGGSINGRKLMSGSSNTNIACSAGLVAVKFGKGIICVAGDGGSNLGSGNQIGSGNGVLGGSGDATDTTTAGDGGSIIGRKLLGGDTSKNVACSAGLVAVKFGKGVICVAGDGGSNVISGNQVLSGNGAAGGSGKATDTTTAGNGGSIIGR